MTEHSFDIHENRHRLKQLEDTGDTKLFENRDAVSCPVCDTPFDRLFSTRQSMSFPENAGSRFCLARGETFIHLFRH